MASGMPVLVRSAFRQVAKTWSPCAHRAAAFGVSRAQRTALWSSRYSAETPESWSPATTPRLVADKTSCKPCFSGVSLRRNRDDRGPFLAAGLHERKEEHQERKQTLGGHVLVVNGEPMAAIA